MTPIMRSLFYLSLLLAPLLVHAGMKIGGIELSNSYKIEEESLVLNGAGIRSKFFVKIYVGAIYLPETTLDSDQILAAAGPKSMQMNMLYKEVEAEKITTGWTEGFRSNLSDIEFRQLEDRLSRFNALFPDLHAGDIVHMDYSPDKGTLLSINNKPLGVIEGEDFVNALLKVWIGDKPADDDLKQGMLGR
jgi:hypothetical protein